MLFLYLFPYPVVLLVEQLVADSVFVHELWPRYRQLLVPTKVQVHHWVHRNEVVRMVEQLVADSVFAAVGIGEVEGRHIEEGHHIEEAVEHHIVEADIEEHHIEEDTRVEEHRIVGERHIAGTGSTD
jgi:hypothetical protein